jgi:hypothetical protein
MHKLPLVLCAALALIGCKKGDTKTAPPDETAGMPKDTAALAKKVKKLEKRLTKIENVLKQAGVPLDEPDPELAYLAPINPLDPVEGPANAKVTIVEAFEFA